MTDHDQAMCDEIAERLFGWQRTSKGWLTRPNEDPDRAYADAAPDVCCDGGAAMQALEAMRGRGWWYQSTGTVGDVHVRLDRADHQWGVAHGASESEAVARAVLAALRAQETVNG